MADNIRDRYKQWQKNKAPAYLPQVRTDEEARAAREEYEQRKAEQQAQVETTTTPPLSNVTDRYSVSNNTRSATRVPSTPEIDDLRRRITEAEANQPNWLQKLFGMDGDVNEAELAAMRNQLDGLEDAQAQNEYMRLLDDPQFQGYVQQGLAMENPTYSQYEGWNVGPWRIGGQDYENAATYARDNRTQYLVEMGTDLYYMGKMSGDEIAIYSGILARDGEEKAREYFEYLKPTLLQRERDDIEQNIIASKDSEFDFPWIPYIASGLAGAQ